MANKDPRLEIGRQLLEAGIHTVNVERTIALGVIHKVLTGPHEHSSPMDAMLEAFDRYDALTVRLQNMEFVYKLMLAPSPSRDGEGLKNTQGGDER